jgi:hypothetical protein
VTFSEAMTRIEDALTGLKLHDKWGDPIVGDEAVGALGAFVGERLDELLNELNYGIAPDEYCNRYLALIAEYELHLFRSRLSQNFANMLADQKELDLI